MAATPETGRNLQTWVTHDQYDFMREFDDFKNMSNAEMMRFILHDFFEARGLEMPPDPEPHGDWRRGHSKR